MALYSPAFHFDFVNYDDPDYVVENPHVNHGLTADGLGWAFQAGYAANWHPLTWMSHMLDCQLFDLRAGGHHATNVLLHALNSVLLFLVLARMTGAFWRAAMVAALFAWHPMHVESVAWISERKDVLSAFFWILALWAYVRYAQGPNSKRFYALTLVFFVLGLMAKPMVITLPFALLLLDWWPLRREAPVSKLVCEKIPFFALAAGAAWVTVLAQGRQEALSSLHRNPLSVRVLNVFLAYLRYCEKLVWPSRLSVIYTFYYRVRIGEVVCAVVFLSLMFAIGILARKNRPYWLFGWLWFLGTLVPVIGLVQVGAQSMADRYMYLPSIGIFILLCWGACDLTRGLPRRGAFMAVAAIAILVPCVVATETQLAVWKNSGALFSHALALDPDNYVAHIHYGEYLRDQGDLRGALNECQKAVELAPDYLPGFRSLASVLSLEASKDASMTARAYAQVQPELELGVIYNPANPNLRHLLGTSLALGGNFDAAEQQFAACVRLEPEQLGGYYDLAQAMTAQHKTGDAIAVYRRVLQSHPDSPEALDDLAWILAADANPGFRNGAEAVELATRACEITKTNDAMKIATLAAACAETGRFDEAVGWAEKGREVAASHGQTGVAARNLELEKFFKARRPFHENP